MHYLDLICNGCLFWCPLNLRTHATPLHVPKYAFICILHILPYYINFMNHKYLENITKNRHAFSQL